MIRWTAWDKSLHFEDTNRYRYLVDNVVYNSILKRDFLRDTLDIMEQNLLFIQIKMVMKLI